MAAYTKTVWVNNTTPALSAANLNHLTNELEAQATEIGLTAAPTTPVLDDGNRPNENPLSQSGAWTTLSGVGALQIVSNQIKATTAYSCSYRGSYTDVDAYVQLGTIPASANDFELLLRLTDTQAPIRDANKSAYRIAFEGKVNYAIGKYVNGAYTELRAMTAWSGGALADNADYVLGRVFGSTIEVWFKRGAAAWTLAHAMTDPSLAGPGAIGLLSESTTNSYESFGGGTATSAHTLPNWVDGVAPALTAAAPLNEMERILDLVAADQGLSYTPTVWAAGWSPARNAINLNKMEIQAELNRDALDGVAYQNPIGAIRYGGNFALFTNKNLYKYYIISYSDAVAASAQAGLACGYTEAGSVSGEFWTGVDAPTALANDWILRDSGGNLINTYGNDDRYLGDVSLAAFRDAWVSQVLARAGYGEGVFLDNCVGSLLDLTSNVYPVKFPTRAAWFGAQRDFILNVGPRLKAAGRYVVVNAIDREGDDQAIATKVLWQAIAPGVSALCHEGWMRHVTAYILRSTTSHYQHYWNQIQALVDTAQNAGVDFIGVTVWNAYSTQAMRYCKASFLLDWDGGGGGIFFCVDTDAAGGYNYNSTQDPWNLAWTSDMGLPTAAKVAAGNGWKRTYQNGRVLVNPQPTTQTVDGVSIPATDAYMGV